MVGDDGGGGGVRDVDGVPALVAPGSELGLAEENQWDAARRAPDCRAKRAQPEAALLTIHQLPGKHHLVDLAATLLATFDILSNALLAKCAPSQPCLRCSIGARSWWNHLSSSAQRKRHRLTKAHQPNPVGYLQTLS